MKDRLTLAILVGFIVLGGLTASAETKMPAIFGSRMVLQRDMPVKVWGWDDAGKSVTVEFAGQTKSAVAADDGRWEVVLDALKTSAEGRALVVTGSTTQRFDNVLVGEVWLCSGQSNMQWSLQNSDDPDLESLTAKYSKIRFISVPQVGTQEPQNDFRGQWNLCTPETVKHFSAVGYFFGRQLHQTLDVPIGLINNAWGGSSAEAWVRRDVLEASGDCDTYIEMWEQKEADMESGKSQKLYDANLAKWQQETAAAKAAGKRGPRKPRHPEHDMRGQHRPGNLYAGVLHPIIGYGIRGTIWYQGESNAGRAWNYRKLFPLMITHWREQWGQGDFPFYWVQLADFQDEVDQPTDSNWAELRESQTLTLSLPNTGQAVITDLGEAHDIHPRNKQGVAKRLARLALAKDYGLDIVCRSPEYRSMEKQGNKIVVAFDHVGPGLDTFDVREPLGFAICGEDKVWHNAKAQLQGRDKVQVWCDTVADPIAVRYAWAQNPVCNLQNRTGLPVTPFRTDDFPLTTAVVAPKQQGSGAGGR